MVKKGFTLIEIVLVITLVAILLAVALPSYQSHVLKSRRTAAAACLSELAALLEMERARHLSYRALNLAEIACVERLSAHFDFAQELTAQGFTVRATAKGAQAEDQGCISLSLSSHGAQQPIECWLR